MNALPRILGRSGRFDQAAMIRHVALIAAAGATLLVHAAPDQKWLVRVIPAVVGANLLCYLAISSKHARLAGAFRLLSPCLGIAGWAALIHLTSSGAAVPFSSPFTAGLGLEVILSAITFQGWGIALVTGMAFLALCILRAAEPGAPDINELDPLLVQSAFLVLFGLVAASFHSRLREAQKRASDQGRKLCEMQEELDDARALERVGVHAAELGHGLKNAVHSLRGFAALLGTDHALELQAMKGLHSAIDRLQDLAAETLHPGDAARKPTSTDGARAVSIVDDACLTVRRSYPRLSCTLSLATPHGFVPVPCETLHEIVTNLLLNGAESMKGQGVLTVEGFDRGREWEIRVSDRGPGIQEETLTRLFRPGFSTKAGGSGFGLHVTRRSVESHGGRVLCNPKVRGGGASFSVLLPVLPGHDEAFS